MGTGAVRQHVRGKMSVNKQSNSPNKAESLYCLFGKVGTRNVEWAAVGRLARYTPSVEVDSRPGKRFEQGGRRRLKACRITYRQILWFPRYFDLRGVLFSKTT